MKTLYHLAPSLVALSIALAPVPAAAWTLSGVWSAIKGVVSKPRNVSYPCSVKGCGGGTDGYYDGKNDPRYSGLGGYDPHKDGAAGDMLEELFRFEDGRLVLSVAR